MHRSTRLRRSARLLGALALLLTLSALLVGQGSASTLDAVAPPYDQSDAFWSWPGSVLLHVGVTPAEATAGYVVSDPYYIDCPWACTRPYDVGQTVVLTAFPTNGFTFTGWDGEACAGQGNPCTLTMTANTIVTAQFSGHYVPRETPPAASSGSTLTVAVNGLLLTPGNDVVTSSPPGINCSGLGGTCSATFSKGANVSLQASGSGADVFLGWSGAVSGSANPVNVTMSGSKSVTAVFCFFLICGP
jgi:hypothetical protein